MCVRDREQKRQPKDVRRDIKCLEDTSSPTEILLYSPLPVFFPGGGTTGRPHHHSLPYQMLTLVLTLY